MDTKRWEVLSFETPIRIIATSGLHGGRYTLPHSPCKRYIVTPCEYTLIRTWRTDTANRNCSFCTPFPMHLSQHRSACGPSFGYVGDARESKI